MISQKIIFIFNFHIKKQITIAIHIFIDSKTYILQCIYSQNVIKILRMMNFILVYDSKNYYFY